ncbi:MAG: ATP-binding protein [bacterium]|nr:ATP-binding protein [bacterium]
MSIRSRLFLLLFLIVAINSLLVSQAIIPLLRPHLEEELARRLRLIGFRVASSINPDLVGILQPGDEPSRLYQQTKELLSRIIEEEELTRVSIINRGQRILIDSQDQLIGVPFIGLELSKTEMESILEGHPFSSILYQTKDGELHKNGYLPLKDSLGKVIGVIRVEAGSRALAIMDEARKRIIYTGLLSVFIASGLGFIFLMRIIRPVEELTRTARVIKGGDLSARARIKGKDEIGFLGRTINEMVDTLQTRQKDLQLFSHGVAHEIRNPLAAISGLVELLRREIKVDASSDTLDLVDRIQSEVRRLNSFVSDFLSYARSPEPTKDQADLNHVIEETIACLGAESRVITSFADLSPFRIDREKIKVILSNLISNGLEAMGPVGELTIKTRETKDAAEIWIEDTGGGIPEEIRGKIFTPFFTTKPKGVGLGLSIAHNLLKAHGGEIGVESVEGGTRFVVKLPY